MIGESLRWPEMRDMAGRLERFAGLTPCSNARNKMFAAAQALRDAADACEAHFDVPERYPTQNDEAAESEQ